MKKRMTLFCIQNPNGIPYHSPGLRYSATLGMPTTQHFSTPTGLRMCRRNPVGVENRRRGIADTQGSGVPQPWAVLRNPVGILRSLSLLFIIRAWTGKLNASTRWAVLRNPVEILNTSTCFRVSPPKDVGHGKNAVLRRAVLDNYINFVLGAPCHFFLERQHLFVILIQHRIFRLANTLRLSNPRHMPDLQQETGKQAFQFPFSRYARWLFSFCLAPQNYPCQLHILTTTLALLYHQKGSAYKTIEA